MTEKKRILIAHSSEKFCQQVFGSEIAAQYEVTMVHDGFECVKKIAEFTPDLLIVELLLPGRHGIEILEIVKAHKKKTGVIIVTSQAILQNYRSAIENGADFFLSLPTSSDHLFHLTESFFRGELSPAPFAEPPQPFSPDTTDYIPQTHSLDHYIRFWGTRGSTPVSGPEYYRFGGNTSCLEVRQGDDLIIIDAGTGIRPLGLELMRSKPKHIHIFISHYHWDHILGFPFFAPIFEQDCEISIWAPVGFDQTAEEIFHEILAPAFFPIRLDEILAKVHFNELRDLQRVVIGEIAVEVCHTYHPSATFGFKITTGGESFGYVTDNEIAMGYHGSPKEITRDHPVMEPHEQMIKFFKGCDLMIHEGQYSPQEYKRKSGWGHSSIANASLLIKYIEAKRWYVTHHDPNHTDEDLQKKILLHRDILQECEIPCRVHMAFDHLALPFPMDHSNIIGSLI